MNDKKIEYFSGWDEFLHLFSPLQVPAKTILLEEGQISKKMFFIEEGCLRTWINNDGSEITTRFFFEKEFIGSIESFLNNQPSAYSIESIETCKLLTMSREDYFYALSSSAELKKKMEEHLLKRLFKSQEVLYSFLKNSPEQRYIELLLKNPQIIQRVPQHYIASYLGITPVSLSRIRNRVTRSRH